MSHHTTAMEISDHLCKFPFDNHATSHAQIQNHKANTMSVTYTIQIHTRDTLTKQALFPSPGQFLRPSLCLFSSFLFFDLSVYKTKHSNNRYVGTRYRHTSKLRQKKKAKLPIQPIISYCSTHTPQPWEIVGFFCC